MEVYSQNKTQLWINAPVVFATKDAIYIGYVVGVEITAAGIYRLEVMVDNGTKAYSEYIYDSVAMPNTDARMFPVITGEDLNKALVLTTPVFDIPVKDKRVKGKNYSYDEVVDFFEKRIRKLKFGNYRSAKHNLSLTNNGERIGITIYRSQQFDWYTNKATGQVRVSLDAYAYNVSHSCDGKDLLREPRLIRAAKETLE